MTGEARGERTHRNQGEVRKSLHGDAVIFFEVDTFVLNYVTVYPPNAYFQVMENKYKEKSENKANV